jgi:carboxylesterase
MPQPKTIDPSAYAADGGAVGVLLIHGYTGSAAETRPMGKYLAARGLTVRCPLLSGHGSSPRDLTHVRWQGWVDEVESSLSDLEQSCGRVFVGGLSLGGLLTLWLGSRHPEIAGLIPMAPAVAFQSRLAPVIVALRYFLKFNPFGPMGDDDLGDPKAAERLWCYDKLPLWGAAETYLLQRRVRRALPSIRQPILAYQGRRDAQLSPLAAQIVLDRVASTDKTLVWLENSGHNLLIDGEREEVWAGSYAWIVGHAGSLSQQEISFVDRSGLH